MLIVVGISGVLVAIAVPQMIAQRRLTRTTAVTREIMTQLRYARQLAMSQSAATPTGTLRRVAFTFQYDDAGKRIRIIGPIPAGTAALTDGLYPNNAGSTVVVSVPLTQGGLPDSEIGSGIPASLPGSPFTIDGITGAGLAGGTINITFQPDGSVIDSTNTPVDRAILIYNNYSSYTSQGTASAISVRGSSGRVKIWRYTVNANANASTYAE
jgi:type II secretory pathway pseudopilin PulG